MKKRVLQSTNNPQKEETTKKYLIRGIIIGIIIGLIIGIILVIVLIFIKVGNFSINEWSVANCTRNNLSRGEVSSNMNNNLPSCSEHWSCASWSSCANNQQTRICTDSNNCGTTNNKPLPFQCCGSSAPTTCTESWTCGDFGYCVGGEQNRTCTDSNNCGTTANEPTLTQGCGSSAPTSNGTCTENWDCGVWYSCTNNVQTRICTDSNNCGTTANEPTLTQGCGSSAPTSNGTCTESWTCGDFGLCDNSTPPERTRICTDSNNCGTTTNEPSTTQLCAE